MNARAQVGKRVGRLPWAAVLLSLLVAADYTTTYLCLTTRSGLAETGLVAKHIVEHYGMLGLALLDIAVVVLLVGAAVLAKSACDWRGEYRKGEWVVRLALYPYTIAAGYAVLNNVWWLNV